MGSSASIPTKETSEDNEKYFLMFKELTKFYENEYLPDVKSGNVTERQAFVSIRAKFQDLVLNSEKEVTTVFTESTSGKNNNGKNYNFQVGDVVRVYEQDMFREGVVIETLGSNSFLRVDFGQYSNLYNVTKCVLVVKSDEYEVGDKVEIKLDGMHLYFVGEVIRVSGNGMTVDVMMSGEDNEDVEHDVPKQNVRKLMTKRAIAKNRWRRASEVVNVSNSFLRTIQSSSGILHEHGGSSRDRGDSDPHLNRKFRSGIALDASTPRTDTTQDAAEDVSEEF